MGIVSDTRPTVKRWLVFNVVGAMGICVQMGDPMGTHLRPAPELSDCYRPGC